MSKLVTKRQSIAGRFFRRLIEKWLGRYYEGPDPPRRIEEELRIWMYLNPDADRETVIGYCGFLLDSSYREGFTRGYEWQERGWGGPEVDPEVLAELEAQDWSLADSNPRVRRILESGYDEADPLGNVSAPDKRAFFEMLSERQGYRIIAAPQQFEDELEE